jgi:hypothetical protein
MNWMGAKKRDSSRKTARSLRPRRLWLEALENRLAPTVNLSIANPQPINEGDSGTTDQVFVVTRSGDLAPIVQADYTTVDGTAKAGVDYMATAGTLTFTANQTTATISVPIIGNTILQPNRSFAVQLSNPMQQAEFAGQQTFTVGSSPQTVVVADLNGDGFPDLIVPNFSAGSVTVLVNTTAPGAATPSFGAPQSLAVGTNPQSVAVTDLNGDGKPDLVVANYGDGTVSVLLNGTAPGATTVSFFPQQTFAVGAKPQAVAVVDLNGDGSPDLAVTNNSASGTVSVLLNTTPGGSATASFAAPQTFAVGANPQSLAIADLNGDGVPDLVVANDASPGSVSVLLNTTAPGASTPSFAGQETFAVGNGPVSIAAADLNGDGRPDVTVANVSDASVSVLLNTTVAGATTASFAAQQSFAVGGNPRSVTVRDLNGDGRPDLAVSNSSDGTTSVLLNTTPAGAAAPTFAAQQTFAAGNGVRSLAIADLNNDGRPDVVAANFSDGTVSVLPNATSAVAATPSFSGQSTFAVGTIPYSVTIADLNGDGRPDLAVANDYVNSPGTPGTVSVLLNQAAPGSATPSFAGQQMFAAAGHCAAVATGDFNGDGRLDLVVPNFNLGTVSVLMNTTPPGAATPTFAVQQTFAVGAHPFSVSVADLNGDGRPDIIAANFYDYPSDTVSVLMNTTAPGATTPSFAGQTFAVGRRASFVGVTDLNCDGRPDLIVTNAGLNTLSVLLNTTPAGSPKLSFAPQQTFALPGSPYSVAIADLNGDGRPDIVTAENGSQNVAVLLDTTAPGAVTVSLSNPQTFAVAGRNPFSVIVADLNGDGLPDIVAANYGRAGSVSVLQNTTAAGATTLSFVTQETFAVDAGPQGVAVGDINGDGLPDLAIANKFSDTVSVLTNTTQKIVLTTATATGTILDDDAITTLNVVSGNNQSTAVNTAFAADLVVSAENAAGHFVQGASVTFSTSGTGAGATFPSGDTATTDANGQANVPVSANNTVGTYTVNATVGSVTVQFTLTNNPGPTAQFAVSAPASATAGSAFSFTVTAEDAQGNPTPTYTGTVKFTSTDPAAGLPDSSTLTNGTGTFSATLKTAGSQTISATDTVTGSIAGISNTIAVVGAAATKLVVSAPAAATAGSAFTVTVTAEDTFGNVATSYTGTDAFTSTDIAASLPAGSTLTNGVGTFSVTLETAGNQTITATDTTTASIAGTSGPVGVTAATAVKLIVSAPATATAGAALDFTVTAEDAFGNVATGYAGTDTFKSSDGAAILPGDSLLTNGVGTFSVTFKTAGIQGIRATDLGNPSIVGTSGPVSVSAAAVAKLAVSTPATATAGVAITVTVTAEDAFGNVVTGYTGTDTITSSDGAAILPGNSLLSNGVGAFSVTLKTAGNQTITATDTATSSITGMSNGVGVVAAVATKLTVQGPSTATAGTALNLTVTALDAFGNVATSYSDTVTFSSSDSAAGLPGNTALNNGVGTVSVTLKTAGNQTIAATDTVSSSITGTSNIINVGAATAAKLIVTASSTATSGTAFNFTVTAQDAFNNTATGYGGTVEFSSSDAQATLPANYTFTSADAGTHTFSITMKTGGSQSVTVTDANNHSLTATQSGISVTVLSISGTVFQDININGVQDAGEPGAGGQFVFLDLNGSGSFQAGDPIATTDSNGNYQLTGLAAGTYTVRPALLGGWLLEAPAAGSYQVTLAGTSATAQNFAEVPTSITVPLTLPLTTPFPKQGSANADYVEALYRAVLARDADPNGLAAWAGLLDSGKMTRLQVVQGIRQSQEHFTQEVTEFYTTILNRGPDPTGLQNWVQLLESGQTTEEQVAFGFLNSPEYLSKGDKYFVDHMYLSLLGRGFDAGGEAQWLDALGDDASGTPTHAATMTHAQVINGFLHSPESLTRLVEGYYQVFLQRLADPNGLNNWLNLLNLGGSFLTIGQGFLTSDEFYNNAAGEG